MGKYLNNPLGRKVLCGARWSGDGWATSRLLGEGEKWGKARQKRGDGVSQSGAQSWNQRDYVTVRMARGGLPVSPWF